MEVCLKSHHPYLLVRIMITSVEKVALTFTCRIVGQENDCFLSPKLQLFCGEEENWSWRTDVPFLFPSSDFICISSGQLWHIVSWKSICQPNLKLQKGPPLAKAATTSLSLPVILFTVETSELFMCCIARIREVSFLYWSLQTASSGNSEAKEVSKRDFMGAWRSPTRTKSAQ